MFWVESSRVAIEYLFLDVGNMYTKKNEFHKEVACQNQKNCCAF